MKKVKMQKILLAAGLFMVSASVQGQYLRTSYFMEAASTRIQMNPGLQPTKGYFNFPVIGSVNIGASSNVLGTSDIIDILDNGEDLFSNEKLFNRLKDDNRLNVNLNTDILSFGWYRGKGFWSFNIGLNADVGASIPKSMFEYLRNVNSGNVLNGGSFSDMSFELNTYMQIGLGYSRQIGEKLTVGGRVKMLLGIARAEMVVDNFSVDASGNVSTSAYLSTTMKGGGLSFNDSGSLKGFDIDGGNFGIAGTGFGVDLGASYKIWDNLTVSASVLDLGFINWKGSETVVASSSIDENISLSYDDSDFLSLERYNLVESESADNVKKKLYSTVLVAGEYALLNNKLSVGAMYTVRFAEPKTLNELTLLATLRPSNALNVAVSYSPIMASGKSLGLALKLGPLFLGTDYMFFGSNSQSVNAFFGFSFPIGKK